ncbi:MAG: hypothetical protein FRX49_04610 [Trebouxia sp. A1-2]|nr:MAG: hypothetical protein FRX49_04610 [Trebouxia sp. A1-2]
MPAATSSSSAWVQVIWGGRAWNCKTSQESYRSGLAAFPDWDIFAPLGTCMRREILGLANNRSTGLSQHGDFWAAKRTSEQQPNLPEPGSLQQAARPQQHPGSSRLLQRLPLHWLACLAVDAQKHGGGEPDWSPQPVMGSQRQQEAWLVLPVDLECQVEQQGPDPVSLVRDQVPAIAFSRAVPAGCQLGKRFILTTRVWVVLLAFASTLYGASDTLA